MELLSFAFPLPRSLDERSSPEAARNPHGPHDSEGSDGAEGWKIRCAFQMRPAGAAPDDPFSGGNLSFNVGDDPARVTAVRQALLARLPGGLAICETRQVHGTDLLFNPDPREFTSPTEAATLPEADGMATDRPGLALLIKTADCQPVLLAHESRPLIAALHVGWRGNRLRFPQKALRVICERWDVAPADFFAVRGPSLGPSAAEFVNFDAEWGPDFERWHDRQARRMDLWRLTRDQLREAGLRDERIFGLDLCTFLLQDRFFSFRRQRVCGRQGSFIWIERSSG